MAHDETIAGFDLANLRILCADCHIGRRSLARPQDA